MNGRCGSRIADVNGVLKGDIQDVNNIGGFVAYSPPLDTYTGAAAAYSVRLLRTAYTGDCMRVRRVSDNVEADIAFDAGELKLTSGVSNTSDGLSYTDFADFVDHTGTPTDAFCRYWYDQSGNANDAGQSTEGSQPQIYDATSGLITENGIPTLSFNTDELTTAQIWPAGSSNRAYAMVAKPNNNTNAWLLVHGHSDTATHFIITQEFFLRLGGGVTYDLTGAASTSQTAIFVDGSATNLNGYNVYFNGTIETGTRNNGATTIATSNNVDTPSIGSAVSGAVNANIQEIICWNSDQSTNRTGIECNTNGYFKIY